MQQLVRMRCLKRRVSRKLLAVQELFFAKLDGSARGGVIVPVAERFGLPVKFVGLGESADDLATFDPEAFVNAMLEGVLRP